MASEQKAWAFVLSNEDTVPPSGKLTREPNGGQARLGINSIAHPEALARGFYAMSLLDALEFAEDIFKYDYWSRIMGYNLENQIIASKLADLSFNESPHEATLLLQRAINALRGNEELGADGHCGPKTIAAVNTYLDDPDVEALYAAFVARAKDFYEGLRDTHPERYSAAVEAGWMTRLKKRPAA